jgi:hypothetical protein
MRHSSILPDEGSRPCTTSVASSQHIAQPDVADIGQWLMGALLAEIR